MSPTDPDSSAYNKYIFETLRNKKTAKEKPCSHGPKWSGLSTAMQR